MAQETLELLDELQTGRLAPFAPVNARSIVDRSARQSSAPFAPAETDCMAGHVRLELGNVEFSDGKF